jgi:hypothetical protein
VRAFLRSGIYMVSGPANWSNEGPYRSIAWHGSIQRGFLAPRADVLWPSADAGHAAEGRGNKSRRSRSSWAGCLPKVKTLGVGISTVQRVKAEMPAAVGCRRLPGVIANPLRVIGQPAGTFERQNRPGLDARAGSFGRASAAWYGMVSGCKGRKPPTVDSYDGSLPRRNRCARTAPARAARVPGAQCLDRSGAPIN